MTRPRVRVRRVYDEPASDDGTRVLVDRIWPRGLAKTKAEFAEWCKEVAPSTELRKWYGHDPARTDEFAVATGPSSVSPNGPPHCDTSATWPAGSR